MVENLPLSSQSTGVQGVQGAASVILVKSSISKDTNQALPVFVGFELPVGQRFLAR